jgi:Icc-related predicted phosphoesterase
MRLLYVSDLHYTLKQFDWLLARAGEFDATVIGGDLLDLASALDQDVQIAIVEKYFNRLRKKGRLVVSSGNHDGDSRNEADESVADWLQHCRTPGMHVDGDGFDFGDWRVSVCPWWDGETSRAELERFLEKEAETAKGHHWLWVHHAPPTGAKTCWTGKKFAGDEALKGWIDRFRPQIVLSGHIHNSPFYEAGSWIDRIGETWVFNPGKQIGPQPTTIALDLEAMTAEWTSLTGTSVRDLRVA